MTVKLKLLAASLLFISVASFAQQPGSVEYNTVLMPAHGVGDTKSPRSGVRWGAYARGDDRTLGYTVGGRTEDEARALAVEDCKARGSTNCVAIKTFLNACIAVAAADINHRFATMSPKGLRWVRRESLKDCGSNCKIVYEGCAVP
ncbi:DUF4189 domain-containing protein [Stenotrophomonas sp. S41]|uniref:DUF4189 domain-containing protein n=1 Tax=Stenotrophomonas sp. S41 TaxID=2767464 RepID=UPI00190AB1DC|nr:DUF4189 domain-containing protein [Stenotrophomonas sp. S41]MBK0014133.1 DUF4189 domain-containing protein [Stenotrophomonas sp. S41]